MERMSINAIEKFAESISRDNNLLKEQFKEVEEKYPLVMLAYSIQQAVIAELSMPRSIEDMEMGPLYAAVESVQADIFAKTRVEQRQRLEKLKTCLMRALTSDSSSGEQYLAGVACFENYVKGDDR